MGRPKHTSPAVVATRLSADGIERIVVLGPGRYLRERLTSDERVVASRPVSREEAEAAAGHPLTATPGTEPRLTVERALLRLLYENVGEVVGYRDVEAVMDRRVTRQAVWKAAQRLSHALPIEAVAGPRGGYRLPVPVEVVA